LSEEEKMKLFAEARLQAEARQKYMREMEEADKKDIEMNKKNNLFNNIIKII